VSRVMHSVSGLSWKTPHAYCFSSMGCKAVMASEHDVEITTGVGALEKSAVFSNELGGWKTSLICGGLPVVSKFEKLVALLRRNSNENPELGKRNRDI
jgi:hypothetical protein